MAIPTSNAGSTYYNTNQCYSFNGGAHGALAPLSSQPCSEVIIWNTTGQILWVYDGSQYNDDLTGRFADNQRLEIPAAADASPLQPYVIRGLTNAEQVSARTATGTGKFMWRTQFWSSNPKTS